MQCLLVHLDAGDEVVRGADILDAANQEAARLKSGFKSGIKKFKNRAQRWKSYQKYEGCEFVVEAGHPGFNVRAG